MKKKSYKIAKLERNRFSILTEDLDTCFICGGYRQHLHEILEGTDRLNSMKYGLVLPLCARCHNDIHSSREMALEYIRMCQEKFEEEHTREEFIKIFHRNYL